MNDTLFQKNQGLVYKVFNDCFPEYRYIEEDLEQEGRCALWAASKAFVEDDSFAGFSTFAYRCIKNAMLAFVKRENRARGKFTVVSMEDKVSDDPAALTIEQTVGEEDDTSAVAMLQLIIDCTIDDREKLIVRRKACGFSQKSIAKELNISEMRISEIVKSLYKRVKAKISSSLK